MKHFFVLSWLIVCFAEISSAQSGIDSTNQSLNYTGLKQNSILKTDTLDFQLSNYSNSASKKIQEENGWSFSPDFSFSFASISRQINQHHPYFGFSVPAINVSVNDAEKRQFKSKDWLFYILVILFILFALIRNTFPKYFSDLFRVFFRTTLKQRQISEQLEQTPLPSFLLNGFFIVTGGLYITFILDHFHLNPADNFWLLFLYSCIGLFFIYLVKFIGLKITGWLFSAKEATDAYIFIVFVVNKMIGILLLPFLVILAFTEGVIYTSGFTISWCLIGILLIYRFILTYSAIRNQINVNPFHFFLYLFAFEIVPLLLVYKALLVFLGITA